MKLLLALGNHGQYITSIQEVSTRVMVRGL